MRIRITAIYILLATFIFSTGCKNGAKQAVKEKRQQEVQNKENRVSPAMTATATIGENVVTINYGSPRVTSPDGTNRDGHIWGELVPYNEVWRTGANEATTITFSQNVLVEGQLLEKDIYSLYTIPAPEEFTIIFNWNETQWGAFKYDVAEDALRVNVKPTTTESLQEELKFDVLKDSIPGSGIVRLNWERKQVEFRFKNVVE